MKVFFLHGWTATPDGKKPAVLKEHSHEVFDPPLPDEEFEEEVRVSSTARTVPTSSSPRIDALVHPKRLESDGLRRLESTARHEMSNGFIGMEAPPLKVRVAG